MVILMSWNVRGIFSSTLCLSSLLDREKCDIAVLSEHKLKQETRGYLDTIHTDFLSFVKFEDEKSTHTNVLFAGRGGVAIMYRKCLAFSIREIPCFDSNRIIGIELKTCNGCVYILGAYLPSDNNVDNYAYELNLLENLYNHYSNYGKVIIAGDLNGSLVDSTGTNERKSEVLSSFIFRKNLCTPYIDFKTCGENYTFTYKKTTLDYVLFDKSVLTMLHRYLTYVEGSFSLTSDHLPIIATFNLRAMQCHHLKTSQTKLLAWHKATAEKEQN